MSDNENREQGMDAREEESLQADNESVSPEEELGNPEGLTLDEALRRLAEAEDLAGRQRDEVLRARADVQNMQRRTEQAVEKAHKFGQEKLIGELLVVIDNLERALEAVRDRDNEAVKALYDGVELTLKSFLDALGRFNVVQIDPQGEPFDPQQHEAMTTQESAELEPNSIVAVMQKGYSLNGRVIRPARVIVSRAPSGKIDENV